MNELRLPQNPKKAAFLDRDGVINYDLGYVHKVSDFLLLPDAVKGMLHLQELGYLLVVVTNQSGIGRGYFSELEYHAFSDHMVAQLTAEGIKLSGVYFCPHKPHLLAPAENQPQCCCRKPAPGLILKAALDLNIIVDQSIIIGDKQSDMQAGRAAGLSRCFLISDDDYVRKENDKHDNNFSSLAAVAEQLSSETC
jgi:D-glycero-D-manno-heptose 1,7-bisphosphate phosphatase